MSHGCVPTGVAAARMTCRVPEASAYVRNVFLITMNHFFEMYEEKAVTFIPNKSQMTSLETEEEGRGGPGGVRGDVSERTEGN